MTLHSALKSLLVLALALPIAQAVLVLIGGLLSSMGDSSGAACVRRIGTACLVFWTVDLVGLVLLTAVAAIARDGATPNAVHPPNDLELDD